VSLEPCVLAGDVADDPEFWSGVAVVLPLWPLMLPVEEVEELGLAVVLSLGGVAGG
jgi:hypothetical protein